MDEPLIYEFEGDITKGSILWYPVTLTEGETYRFVMDGDGTYSSSTWSGLDAVFYVTTDTKQIIASGNNQTSTTYGDNSKDAYITFTAPYTGTYYLRMQGYNGTAGHFRLSAKAFELPELSVQEIADKLTSKNIHWEKETLTYNTELLSDERAELMDLAFATWADITGLTFIKTTGNADIKVTAESGSSTGTPYVKSGIINKALINISPEHFNGTSAMESRALTEMVHEIGHALGLRHPHQSGYVGTEYGVTNDFANDTYQFSILSYFTQHHYKASTSIPPVTPQMADILAAQKYYGEGSARGGRTIYGFNITGHEESTAVLYDFSNYTSPPCLTIYDSGGIDTLNLTQYSMNQRIDLRPGYWSDIGGGVNNIGIFSDSIIEHALSGSGNDVLTGNDSNNTLNGGSGTDVMAGGKGNDTYYVDNIHDTVTELISEGKDTIISTVSFSLSDNVENLTLKNTARTGSGNALNNTITGSNTGNELYGGEGDDIIIGGTGNDTLYGGIGRDMLTGNAGNDIFVFDTFPGIADIISDFSDGDRIALDHRIFTAFENNTIQNHNIITGNAAVDDDDYVIYDRNTGNVYYDNDGTGANPQHLFAVLTPQTDIDINDFTIF